MSSTINAAVLAKAQKLADIYAIVNTFMRGVEEHVCTHKSLTTLQAALALLGVGLVIPDPAVFDKDPQQTTQYVIDTLNNIVEEYNSELAGQFSDWAIDYSLQFKRTRAGLAQTELCIKSLPDGNDTTAVAIPVKDLKLRFEGLSACDGKPLVVTPETLKMLINQTSFLSQNAWTGVVGTYKRAICSFDEQITLPETLDSAQLSVYKQAFIQANESLSDLVEHYSNASILDAFDEGMPELMRFLEYTTTVYQLINEATFVLNSVVAYFSKATASV